MPEFHAARRRRAQQLIRELDADAVLITAGPNVRYLTGLASSNAALLLPADGDRALLATDSRYTGAAQRDAPDLELLTERFIEPALATEASRRGVRRLAFEAHEMTVERYGALTSAAGEQANDGRQQPVQHTRQHDAQSEPARPGSPTRRRPDRNFFTPHRRTGLRGRRLGRELRFGQRNA